MGRACGSGCWAASASAARLRNAGATGEKTTTFDYLGLSDDVVSESVSGQLQRSYQYSPWGERLSQLKRNPDGSSEESFYGYNPHTDVETLTDQNGDTRATYGYTAYGQNDDTTFTGVDKPDAQNLTKEPYNFYRFNAKRFDTASGTYDMGFRDYDPGLNRFLTRDLYNGALADLDLASDSFTSNRYAFAGGNPISNIELDGHRPAGCEGECLRQWAIAQTQHASEMASHAESSNVKLPPQIGIAIDQLGPMDPRQRDVLENAVRNSPCFEDPEVAEATSSQKVVVHDICIIQTAGVWLQLVRTDEGVFATSGIGIFNQAAGDSGGGSGSGEGGGNRPTPRQAAEAIRNAERVGSGLKEDALHRAASFAVEDIESKGTVFTFKGGDGVERTLVQVPGEVNGVSGRFEWIIDPSGRVTHQMFVKGGRINGIPILP
jgi:RHS repeat-associated protein